METGSLQGWSDWLSVSAHSVVLLLFFLKDLPKPIRANFVLDVESDELFITAGLQDRVVQVTVLFVVILFSFSLLDFEFENSGYPGGPQEMMKTSIV